MYFFGKGILYNINVGDVVSHIKVVDPLTSARSNWKANFDYNLYGDPALSLFGKNVKSNNDVVLLLDGSGSMLDENKWTKAVDASVLFHQLQKELRHPAFRERYNTIVFRQNCSNTAADVTTAVPPGSGLKDVSVPLTQATLAPYEPENNFCTPIGEGLEMAIDQFDLSEEESFYSDKTILLLSDGKHNRGIEPTMVAFPDEEIKVQAVGLGEDYIEPQTISDIADMTDGDYRISPSSREMENFFCQILCNTSWKLQDITVTGTTAPIDQDIAAFIVVWDDPAASISFELDPPGGAANVSPGNLAGYPPMEVTWHPPAAGATHAFYICKNIPEALLGDWDFANINNGGAAVPLADVLLKVIEDPRVIADFDIEDGEHVTGQPIMLTAKMTEDGKPLTGLTDVYAEIVSAPEGAMGELMSDNAPDPGYMTAPDAKDQTAFNRYLLGVMDKLGMTSLYAPGGPKIVLHDDGANGDLKANDGIYTGCFVSPPYEGSYTFVFRSRGANSDDINFDRTETLSEYVAFGASPEETEVDVTSSVANIEEKTVTATISVTPRDTFGNRLGPLRGGMINIRADAGSFRRDSAGKLLYDDPKNGSYIFTLVYPMDETPVITVTVGDVITEEKKELTYVPPPPPPRKLMPSLHLGAAIPVGTFADEFDPGINILLDVEYQIRPAISAVLYAGYNAFGAKTSLVDDTYWINISANAKYRRPISPSLFLTVNAGPGLYIPEEGDNQFGSNIGVGLEYEFNRNLTFEVGGDYHAVYDPEFQFIHLRAGVIYSF